VPLVEEALKADKHDLDLRAVVLFFDMWEPLGSRQMSVGRYPITSLFKRHDIGLPRDCFDAKPPLMKGAYPEFIEQRLWWRFDLNKTTSYPHKCSPVIADGGVFVADDQSNVWRHNLYDGAVEWKYESLGRPLKGIVQLLQYAERSLVFGCYDGTVTRLDAGSGDIIWRWRQDSSVHATPALDLPNGRLFVNTEQWNQGAPFGHLQCLDWKSGKTIWTLAHKYWPPGTPEFNAQCKAVIATCNDQTILCVDADSGELRWKKKTNR
jgi:outer membrane protein assembly factor BamB